MNLGPLDNGVARGVPDVLVGIDSLTEDTSHCVGNDFVGAASTTEVHVRNAMKGDVNFIFGGCIWGGRGMSLEEVGPIPSSTASTGPFIPQRWTG